MTIQPRPDQERLIDQALRAGLIAAAAEALDVGLPRLREQLRQRETPPAVEFLTSEERETNLVELFAPVRGLLSDEEIDQLFSRDPSPSRAVDLS